MPKTLVFMDSSYRGWILEGIIKESAGAIGHKIAIIWIPQSKAEAFKPINIRSWLWFLWPTKSVLIVNQKLSVRLRRNSFAWFFACATRNARVYFTHEADTEDFIHLCNNEASIKSVVTFNSSDLLHLESLISREIEMRVSFGAVDHSKYKPLAQSQEIDSRFVLIVGLMSQRKNPEVIRRVIATNPDYEFVIHGENWESLWDNETKRPKNLELIEFNFERHPKLMREASCLLTISDLEGGPYPTLEALASGTPVVASKTGWNPELINESNGFLVSDLNSGIEIRMAIGKAFELKKAKMHHNLLPVKYNWSNVGQSLYSDIDANKTTNSHL